jgi:epoxyqueuosine reductase
MSPEPLIDQLRRRSREQGFDACVVATAERLERDEATLEAWLGHERHAGMSWMTREPAKRADPRELLPGCRSVVVLAMNYFPGEEAASVPAPRARVALYARGRDYHRVFAKKLKALAAWLDDTVVGSVSRAFVDTGPVLERAWAERAGLGWIAKNANLLTRELGSWLLIGEVLTTAVLEPDPGPHAEFCGSCTACLDACPTDAIVADGVVDSNRCISYWTIEHRGPVPAERRPGMGEWIFGCDICQEVCPWNKTFALAAEDDPFGRREELRGLDPREIVALDETTFRARYSGTALMRAKWEGMRRNACVVLGNRARVADLPLLAALLGDDDPVVAGHAAWAVAAVGGPAAREALEQAAAHEDRPDVLSEVRQGLARVGD